MAISKLLEDVIREKARGMLDNPEWVRYGQTFEKNKAFPGG